MKLPFNLSAKFLALIVGLTAASAALYGAYYLGARSCAGAVAVDTVEELQDDQETANVLSTGAAAEIRALKLTIAGLRREKSEIDNVVLPADAVRLREAAVSAAFPASR